LYYALVGHPPFPDGTLPQRLMMHQTQQPESIRKQRPEVPEDLVAIVDKMTAKRREHRYAKAEDVAEALARWIAAHGTATDTPGKPPGSSGSWGRLGDLARRATTEKAPSPGPVINEDELTLAPLEDEQKKGAGGTAKPAPAPDKPATTGPASAPETVKPGSTPHVGAPVVPGHAGRARSTSGAEPPAIAASGASDSGAVPAVRHGAAGTPPRPGNAPGARPIPSKPASSILDEVLPPSQSPVAGDTLDELLAGDTLKGGSGQDYGSFDEGTPLLPGTRRGLLGNFEKRMRSTWFVIAMGAVLGALFILVVGGGIALWHYFMNR